MKTRAHAALGVIFLLAFVSGCAKSGPAPRQPNEVSAMIIDGELRGGIGDGPRVATEGTLSAGYQPSDCCALDVHISRAYLGKKEDDGEKFPVNELTDIGLGVTATLSDRVRVRLRGGFAAAPPSRTDQSFMRPGVGGDGALLVRLTGPWSGPVRREAGTPRAQIDWVIGAHAWSLGAARTSAGLEGGSARIVALTTGLRLAFDYGLDLR